MHRLLILALAAALLGVQPRAARAQDGDTTNPHGPLDEDLDCSACHTARGWRPARKRMEFDHNRASRFVLSGRHKEAACRSCHLDLRFDGPSVSNTDCAKCHVDVHQGNLAPNCSACHNTVSFTDVAGVPVHARTSFPLTGAHLQLACEACHRDARGGAFTALETDCIACHRDDYEGAQGVDHVALGLPTDCERCHSNLTWAGSTSFDHVTASGGFALVGAHAPLPCTSCHVMPDMSLLYAEPSSPNDCIACHQDDYDRQHAGSGFSVDCLTCHTVDSWAGAAFDHVAVSNGFDLVGAHARLACSSCHAQPDNALLFPTPSGQNDCIACHQDDYDRQHAGSGFPTDCLTCHTVDSWAGAAALNHDADFFPIYSGVHAGKWKSCDTCHIDPNDRRVFTCFNCHAHGQTKMDDKHRGVKGYVYDSNACLSCHPNGKG